MGVFYGQVSQNDNSSVKRRGFTDESHYRDFPDFGNDSPYLFTPMYEASFKGTKR